MVEIETNCRQHFKVRLKLKICALYRVENIVRKGEIACYFSNFSFSLTMFSKATDLAVQNVAMCGNGLIHSHTMTPFDAPEKQAF